ncbi:MAG: beta-galactosidase [Muribaculaceae bacterium]|nr:beta-galactosidase [Muribaculaceae bacterium]
MRICNDKLSFGLGLILIISSVAIVASGMLAESESRTRTEELLKTVELPEYRNPTPGEFPIMAWFSIPANFTSAERYRQLHEAGFNLSYTQFYTSNQVQNALNAASESGVKLMVNCPELLEDTERFVRRFSDNPNVAGWFMLDEPSAEKFDELSALRDRIYQADSTRLVYSNLLPIWVKATRLGTPTYRDYLSSFEAIVRLPMLSYDMYPITQQSGAQAKVDPQFYSNFEEVSTLCRQIERPFWAFCLSTAHFDFPVAREAYLNLEAFCALAYGAQCIQYFTYWQPNASKINFHQAPVDAEGNLTDVYYLVQATNQEIQSLAHIFLDCRVKEVSYTGTDLPDGCKPFAKLPAPFRGSLTTSGSGVLVSHLTGGDGKDYIIMVNRDINHSQSITAPYRGNLRVINPDGSFRRASTVMTLRPGGHVIYRL